MKALIHNERIVQVAEEEFPVHASMHWVELPEGLDPKEPVKVEAEDVFEEREVVDEDTGERVTRPVFVRKDFTLTQDTKAIEDREAERVADEQEETRKRLEKEAVRDFSFEGTTIEALREELNTYKTRINALLGLTNGAGNGR